MIRQSTVGDTPSPIREHLVFVRRPYPFTWMNLEVPNKRGDNSGALSDLHLILKEPFNLKQKITRTCLLVDLPVYLFSEYSQTPFIPPFVQTHSLRADNCKKPTDRDSGGHRNLLIFIYIDK